MKIFSNIIKYVVLPCSSLVGILYGFDLYIIERAKTVVEPVKVKVEMLVPDVAEIKGRTRNIEHILMKKEQ